MNKTKRRVLPRAEAAKRKREQRERQRQWLEENTTVQTAEALVSLLMNGEYELKIGSNQA